jgi:hypothetical protein
LIKSSESVVLVIWEENVEEIWGGDEVEVSTGVIDDGNVLMIWNKMKNMEEGVVGGLIMKNMETVGRVVVHSEILLNIQHSVRVGLEVLRGKFEGVNLIAKEHQDGRMFDGL